MDREIAPEVRRTRITKRWITIAVAIAAVIFSFAATVEWLKPSIRRSEIQIARVERGTIEATLQASGTVIPAIEQVVPSPIDARVLRIERRAGDRVRVGDPLVTLDTASTRLEFVKLNETLTQKQNDSEQLRLHLEDTEASLKAQIEQKRLDGEIFRFKAEQKVRFFKEGLVSSQENLAAATAAKKNAIELTQLEEALQRARKTAAAQTAAAETGVRMVRNDRQEAQRQLDLSMMRSDRDGVITWVIDAPGATIRKGDVVARIADLSSFRVDASISDIHAAEIASGMPVHVRVDESLTVDGTISTVDPRIESGVMKFHVALDPRAAPRLRSNARVDVYVVTDRRTNALRIRRGALGQGDTEDVYVVRNNVVMPAPVRWGIGGHDYIEPLAGLAEGDEVVISNMNDYAGVKSLRLK